MTFSRPHPIRKRHQRARLKHIQGNILEPYKYRRAVYVWLAFADGEALRAWLGTMARPGRVTTAERWRTKPPHALNVALTTEGVARLDLDSGLHATFAQEFRAGMESRAAVLGDVGPSAPEHWNVCRGADVLVSLHGDEAAALHAVADGLGATELERLDAGVLERPADQDDAREHFGFTDGFSQPSFRGFASKYGQPATNGVPLRGGRWRPLALGELVLGYVDEDWVYPEMPGGGLGPDSTYMVWRKLEQDVAAFRAWTLGAAQDDPEEALRIQAKIVGRWHDGTPLVRSPDRPVPEHKDDAGWLNDFRYGDDMAGVACPIGAHVRRANPRDGLPFQHKLTYRQRIVRRGVPYGPELPADPTPAERDAERGLVFVCLNANLSRQFEVVQGEWLADGRAFDLSHHKDPLVGGPQEDGVFVIPSRPGTPPKLLRPLPSFVTTRGGAYLWVPSLPALRLLATGKERRDLR